MTPAELVEALLDTLPGHVRPTASFATFDGSPDWLEIKLDGAEPPLTRVLALAFLAVEIGDEDGPERGPDGRYTLGMFLGARVLVTTPITPAQQAELERFGAEMVDGSAA